MSFSLYQKEADIKGQNAIIAAGIKNLGGETAEELSKFGVNLFLHYHSSKDKEVAEALKAKLGKTVKVELYQGPLDEAKDVAAFFDAAEKFFPEGIDIAINNVGMVLKKPLVEIGPEEWERMNTVNNKVAFFFLQEAAKRINDNGKIVSVVTSLLAALTPYYAAYQGTKAPVEYYSKSAAKELVPKGVSVNCVAPGPMDTPFFYPQEAKGDVDFYKTVSNRNRLTKTSDVVPVIRFLVTEGFFISAQTIFINGTFTAH